MSEQGEWTKLVNEHSEWTKWVNEVSKQSKWTKGVNEGSERSQWTKWINGVNLSVERMWTIRALTNVEVDEDAADEQLDAIDVEGEEEDKGRGKEMSHFGFTT